MISTEKKDDCLADSPDLSLHTRHSRGFGGGHHLDYYHLYVFDITIHRLTPHPDAIKVISACSQLGNRLLPRVDQLVDAARETSHLEKKELLAQVKVRNLICYNYKILTDHKPHPQSPLSQAARRSWQTSSHPSPCSRANPS